MGHPGLHWTQHGQQAKGGDPSPLLNPAEAAPVVLGPVLGAPIQERPGHTGTSPTEDHQDAEGAGAKWPVGRG